MPNGQGIKVRLSSGDVKAEVSRTQVSPAVATSKKLYQHHPGKSRSFVRHL